jgi:hypothetical protein
MTPELRKEASELQLHKRGVRINVQLHVIEADEEVHLRTPDELLQRLHALLYVIVTMMEKENMTFSLLQNNMQKPSDKAFSLQEQAYLQEQPHQLANLDELQWTAYFLAWSAGLHEQLKLTLRQADLGLFAGLFELANSQQLQQRFKMKRKTEVMNWCDLMYRLHWALRHHQLTGRDSPANIPVGMVRGWHKAVNWLCCFEEQDDWDDVSTET